MTTRSGAVTSPTPRLLPRAVSERWPAALGLAFAVFNLVTDDPATISGAFLVLVLATTAYIVIAALVRPRWSWPVLGVLVVVVLTMRLFSAGVAVELAAMGAIAAGAVAAGLARGAFSTPGLPRWQPLAAVGFLALAAVALGLDPQAGRILIGVGLIGHAVWDLLHWRRHEVVAHSLSEWCGVLDLTLAVGLLITAF